MAPNSQQTVALPSPATTPRQDFYRTEYAEPHHLRRKKILRDHPEVKELMGHDPTTKYKVMVMVAVQLGAAYLLRNTTSWGVFIAVSYGLGGVINHSLSLAMHEGAHNLLFGNGFYDRSFAMFSNLPMGLPAAITFRRYHLDHHTYQGVEGVDTDVPSWLEGYCVQNIVTKFIWMFFQGFAYAFRPVLINPKTMSGWEAVNWAVQLAFDGVIFATMGWRSLLYLVVSSFLGMGLHPVAGHFIAEHYISHPMQETYSYYGPLNLLTFNVGYHVEHHDFQNIPGSRLPTLRKMAPEYYDNLISYDSWVGVLWWYLTCPAASPYARVIRSKKDRDRCVREESEQWRKEQQSK
eukprot:gb/GECH01003191.1/.p1 GENE.gb/GECH01003191.1/~~gb/GECH01003191.1/.p1  ORF type:complete len:349 (+),score=49.02 gb/GECH01003191.1/:1-1047(+)